MSDQRVWHGPFVLVRGRDPSSLQRVADSDVAESLVTLAILMSELDSAEMYVLASAAGPVALYRGGSVRRVFAGRGFGDEIASAPEA